MSERQRLISLGFIRRGGWTAERLQQAGYTIAARARMLRGTGLFSLVTPYGRAI
jgi:hypothetical protein